MVWTAILAAWITLGLGRMPYVWAEILSGMREKYPELYERVNCPHCRRKRAWTRWHSYIIATLVVLPIAALVGPFGWWFGRLGQGTKSP
jgi:hypothetical protein